MEFMQSRPLIGFQMDGSHLSNILQTLIRQQQQMMQEQRQTAARFTDLEEDIREIRDHQQELEHLVSEMGGADSGIMERMKDVEAAITKINREVDETRRMAAAAADDADAAGRLADQAHRHIPAIQDSIRKVGLDVDFSSKQSAKDVQDITRALNDLGKTRLEDEKRLNEALREVYQRAERLSRENGVDSVRRMVEELSNRTDENFKSVEESAKAVDKELTRQNQLLQTLSSETDEKHQLLIDALREYERSSNELEEHLVLAGQALARRQAHKRSPIRTTGGLPPAGARR